MKITRTMIDDAISGIQRDWDFKTRGPIRVPIRLPIPADCFQNAPLTGHLLCALIDIERGHIDRKPVERFKVVVPGDHTGVTEYTSPPWPARA